MSQNQVDIEKQTHATATDTPPEPGAGPQSVEATITQLLQNPDHKDAFLVSLDNQPDDPTLPKNWTVAKRARMTTIYGFATFCVQVNSSVMSPAVHELMAQFGVSQTIALLPLTLFVLGFALGPLFMAPASELYGRKVSVLLPFALSIIFTAGTAASTTIEAVLVNRFFAGLFASAPVVSSGGLLSDMWAPAVRGQYMIIYSLFTVLGPTAGSIMGTVLVHYASWQWTCWATVILSAAMLVPGVLFLEETYLPVLAARRARAMRHETGIWLYHARHEEWKLTLHEFTSVHLMRPFAMIGTPIVFFVTSYASFVFGVFYLFITSVADTFMDVHGWSAISSSLAFLWMFAGSVSASVLHLIMGRRYARLVLANNNRPIPEQRLVPMMYAGWTMPAGLALFAWTQRASLHWLFPCLGMYLLGFGFYIIFQNCLNYLVDTYTRYSASAMGANTVMRSLFGAGFPLIAPRMFESLHTTWGTTLLALVALVMYTIPFIFYKFGEKIRQRSPYSHLVE